jgi:hypothetical protein
MSEYKTNTTYDTQHIQAVIGLTGFVSQQRNIKMFNERFTRIELPEKFAPEHIEMMLKDLSLISEIAAKQPDDFLSLNNAILNNDLPKANQLSRKINLTEKYLLANGGNAWGVVIIIAIGAALLLSSDTPPTPQPSDGGPPDAGPG